MSIAFPKPTPKVKTGFACALCKLGVTPRRAKAVRIGGRDAMVHEKCLKRATGGSANKYGAKKQERAGRSFDSGAEAKVFDYLTLLQRGDEIRDLRCQVVIHLTEHVSYRADFQYFDLRLNRLITAEVKGFEGERWRVIRQLWLDVGPTPLWVYVVDRGGGITVPRKYRGGREVGEKK